MTELKAVSLAEVSEGIRKSVKPVSILWQAPDTIAFVARGRAHRSEFHADPSDEVMYMIKGEMNLHYLTADGAEKVALVREGEIIYCPAGVRHSPRFSPDSFLLVLERKRSPDERDRFFWYCEKCHAELYQAVRHVAAYREDPVAAGGGISFAHRASLQWAQFCLSGLKKYQFSKNALLQRGHAKLAIRLPAHAIAPIQASATTKNDASCRSRSFSR